MDGPAQSTTFIYSLDDPITGEPRYIGKTCNPDGRIKSHRKVEHTRKSYWIQSLRKIGLSPRMTILAEVPHSEWKFWERFCIGIYTACGFALVNGDNGGLGHDRLSLELRDKIRKTLTGRKNYALAVPYAKYSIKGELLQVYKSCADGARDVGGSHCNIVRAAQRSTVSYGFLWRRVDSLPEPQITRRPKAPISDCTRAKLSLASMGRLRSEQAKRKMSIAANARRSPTHCKYGHAFTPENVARDEEGYRICIVCRRQYSVSAYRRKVQAGWRRNPIRRGTPAWIPAKPDSSLLPGAGLDLNR